MTLATLLKVYVHRLTSSEISLLAHAAGGPERTHPDGLRTARRGLLKVLEIAGEEQDAELVADATSLLEKIDRAAKN